MFQKDLSHEAALITNAPKKFPFSDPESGAHFDFEDICYRLDKVLKKRVMSEMMRQSVSSNKSKDEKDRKVSDLVIET